MMARSTPSVQQLDQERQKRIKAERGQPPCASSSIE
jgi:hypothetical protein